MSDPSSQPTQPLTDEALAAIRGAIERTDLIEEHTLPLAFTDRKRLLAEVDRLRDALAAETARANERNEQFERQAKRAAAAEAELSRLRTENTAQAAKLTKIEKTWRAAELAWFAGVTVEHQLPIVMKHAAAMRSALGLDQDGNGA